MKSFFSTRKVLTFFLFLSILFAAFSIWYKITYWGFSFKANQTTEVWTIDAHISFKPTGAPIRISLSTPSLGDEFKILNEDIIATGYEVKKDNKAGRIELSSAPKKTKQNIYYRLMVYDNEDSRGKIRETINIKPQKPVYDEQKMQMALEVLKAADQKEGNWPEKIITLFHDEQIDSALSSFLPVQLSEKNRVEYMIELLALKNIPARLVRGVRLQEGKKASTADLMLEAYDGYKWMIYDLNTAKAGLPKNFIIFQRGGVSLLDVTGGENSKIRFSVLKSAATSLKMAEHRAKLNDLSKVFAYSIYNLPLFEQNALKWLMVFPLGILIVVLMRNIIGIPTMGTFTPMLVAMSLVKTGFFAGLVCFALILLIGLLIRTLLSRLNLLLVPRISAVVIFVILIMQAMTIIGYQLHLPIASSAVFFPIIITAWIIERASITWEEEGAANASKEIFFTTLTAIATYFIISNEQIRHITFAFNEINLVILFVVMLLGTYTGYRLTELKRFASFVKE